MIAAASSYFVVSLRRLGVLCVSALKLMSYHYYRRDAETAEIAQRSEVRRIPTVLIFVVILSASQSVFAQAAPKTQTNITVALDGSGQFKTVQEAIMSVPAGSPTNPVVIHIKPGVYKELIYIQHEKRFFHLVGEDAAKTILTYDLHANIVGKDGKPIGTFRTPSTLIDADDFTE